MLEKCPVPNRYCAEGGAEGAADGAPDGAADADGAAPPPADDGLTDLIQAITFHTLSESLSTPPIGGIGPTTFSLPLRVSPCFFSSSEPSEISLNSVSSSLP